MFSESFRQHTTTSTPPPAAVVAALLRYFALCLYYMMLQAPKSAAAAATNGSGPSVAPSDATGSHHPLLLSMVAEELGCKPTDIGKHGTHQCPSIPCSQALASQHKKRAFPCV